MLALEVQATVYGTLSPKGLYSGYIESSEIKRESAYIITKRRPYDTFSGTVTAVITLDSGAEKAVVAPKNEIMYEPEIMEILSELKSIKIEKISCLYEKSCGAVILHKDEATEDYKILLVKNHNGRFYSFPKGHVELRENEKETAKREIKEETNLDVEIIDGFREISDYCPFGKIRKRVVFFLAIAKSGNIKIQESEIDSYTWIPLRGASNVCTYDNDKRVIEKVRAFLDAHGTVL
ncbi:MAG: bis(5'-nucleosyl)-tetraphosphatase [Ruminococcus sp.]